MITQSKGATVITGSDVDVFRWYALRGALKLETLGMSRRGASAYSVVKKEFGFKGTKAKVYEQLDAWLKANHPRSKEAQ